MLQAGQLITRQYRFNLYLTEVLQNIFFKWFQSLSSLLEGKSAVEHLCLALQALRETDKALWQRERDLASPELAESAGLSNDAAEQL
jgi:hypothetical protein